jgi:hypothetical protein
VLKEKLPVVIPSDYDGTGWYNLQLGTSVSYSNEHIPFSLLMCDYAEIILACVYLLSRWSRFKSISESWKWSLDS